MKWLDSTRKITLCPKPIMLNMFHPIKYTKPNVLLSWRSQNGRIPISLTWREIHLFSLCQIKKQIKLKLYFGERWTIALTYLGHSDVLMQILLWNCGKKYVEQITKTRESLKKVGIFVLLDAVISNIQKNSDSFHYNFLLLCFKNSILKKYIHLDYN
jgi:hypothetical protein